jgi:large subunit ribosomal protein L23
MLTIIKPILTEKAAGASSANNTYVFRVLRSSCKSKIKTDIEFLYDVKVLAVNTSNESSRTKRFGANKPKRVNGHKKAYVKVANGQKIELFSGI